MVTSFCLVTLSVYSLNIVTDFEEDAINKPDYKKLQNKKMLIIFFSFISYISALIIGAFVNLKSILVLLIPFITGLFYSIKIRGFRLKNLFIGKNLTVSISWALEASLLPYVIKASKVAVFLILFIFIKGMINTILFDLRDVEGDEKAGIETIPVKLGERKTLWLLLILNTSILPLIILARNLVNSLIFFIIFLYGYVYITYFYSHQAHKSLYGLLIDDEWILWMVMMKIIY